MHEDISDFQIPVYNFLFCQIHKSLENILDDIFHRFLSEMMSFSEFALQIALIA